MATDPRLLVGRLAPHPIEPADLWGDNPVTNHKSITGVLTRNGCKVHPCLPLPSGPGGEGNVWSSGDPEKGLNCQGSQIPCLPTLKLCQLLPPRAASPHREARAPLQPSGPFPMAAYPLREEAWPGRDAGLCWGPGHLESAEMAQEEATAGGRRQVGLRR